MKVESLLAFRLNFVLHLDELKSLVTSKMEVMGSVNEEFSSNPAIIFIAPCENKKKFVKTLTEFKKQLSLNPLDH